MNGDPLITIGDVRPFYCVRGAKKAFDRAGVDFASFVKHGAKASELRGHGFDAMVDRVVEAIERRG